MTPTDTLVQPDRQTRSADTLVEECPVCGDARSTPIQTCVRDFEYGAEGSYDWKQCDTCSVVRLSPQPSDAVLNAAYPPDYHAYVAPSSRLTRWLIEKSRLATGKAYAARIPQNGAVLDIGCSTGKLLEAIGESGIFELLGVEYKLEAARIAEQKNMRIWTGEYEDCDIPESSIDFAIMQNLLEHVRDPVRVLKKTHAVLRSGGRIVGEIPNMASWDAGLFGRYWGGGHAPRHLWHFTPSTLEATLARCGFGDIQIYPDLNTGHWALSIQNYLRRNIRGTAGLVSGRTWYYPLLLLGLIPVNTIQMFRIRTGTMRFEAVRV